MTHTYLLSKYIASIYRNSKNDFNRYIKTLDVRATQSDLLLFIYEHPNYMQKEIAQEMAIDPSLLTRDLRKLVNSDLVIRKTSISDKRSKQVILTEKGEQTALQLQEIMTSWWDHFFESHPEIDATVFFTEFEKVFEALISTQFDSNEREREC